ncbi:MAG: hypothetical protein WBE08_01510 [Methyloceanibacter sp.]|jgi:hypothetical protein
MGRTVVALCGLIAILVTGCSTVVKGTKQQFLLFCFATALVIGGCAKSPESIAPAYISTVNYQNWSCGQLGEEGGRLNQALAEASTQQRNARTNDAIGVILVGIPVSSLSGDNIAPQIANLKGQLVAVQQAGNLKNCGLRIEPPRAEPQPPQKNVQSGIPSY